MVRVKRLYVGVLENILHILVSVPLDARPFVDNLPDEARLGLNTTAMDY